MAVQSRGSLNVFVHPPKLSLEAMATLLRIADHLHPEGATAAEVAAAESLDPGSTFRFLRACASLGLATSTDGKRFGSTSLLDTLRTGNPESLRALALWGGAESHWLPWGRLAGAIRTGTTPAQDALGAPFFDWLATRPGRRRSSPTP